MRQRDLVRTAALEALQAKGKLLLLPFCLKLQFEGIKASILGRVDDSNH